MAIEIIGRKPSHVKRYRIECSNVQCDAVLKFASSDLQFTPSSGGYPDIVYEGILCPQCNIITTIAETSAVGPALAKLEYEEPSQR